MKSKGERLGWENVSHLSGKQIQAKLRKEFVEALKQKLNKMEKIPTAEEFATEFDNMRMPRGVSYQKEIGEVMIEFAKLHVTTALKTASEKGKIKLEPMGVNVDNGESIFDPHYIIDEDSILNAYPLENIK